jgi:hypothetical protein
MTGFRRDPERGSALGDVRIVLDVIVRIEAFDRRRIVPLK